MNVCSEVHSAVKVGESESELDLRRGKYGQFVACTSYPECDFTIDNGKTVDFDLLNFSS